MGRRGFERESAWDWRLTERVCAHGIVLGGPFRPVSIESQKANRRVLFYVMYMVWFEVCICSAVELFCFGGNQRISAGIDVTTSAFMKKMILVLQSVQIDLCHDGWIRGSVLYFLVETSLLEQPWVRRRAINEAQRNEHEIGVSENVCVLLPSHPIAWGLCKS